MQVLKSLQKFTEPEEILKKNKLVPEDVLHLKHEERKALQDEIDRRLRALSGQDLEDFLDKIESIIPGVSQIKNQRWENNHQEIIRVISNFVKTNRQIPTKNQISKETGLSRQTIHKHLTSFSASEQYLEEMDKLKILNHKLLSDVYREAAGGNIKAARLFFEMNGALGHRGTKNYFIQINNLRVDENIIKSLPKAVVEEIEQIICKSIPEENFKT